MQTSIIYGYGFECGNVKFSDLTEFIKKHKDVLDKSDEEKIVVHVAENDPDNIGNCLDELEDYCCDISGEENALALISNVMSRETGILFEFRKDDEYGEGKSWVLLVESMPWQFNSIEKELTEHDFDILLKSYIKDLGLDSEPTEVRIEYFG